MLGIFPGALCLDTVQKVRDNGTSVVGYLSFQLMLFLSVFLDVSFVLLTQRVERPLSNACGARRPFAQCLRMLARRVFFCVEARRACVARALWAISPGYAALFHFDSNGKLSHVQSSNLLLPARFGLPAAFQASSRGRELQGFSDPGGHAKEKSSVARVNCDDGGLDSAKLCAYVDS